MSYAFLIEICYFLLFSILGMAVLPARLTDTGQKREAAFLLAPVAGSVIWVSFTMFGGMILPYNAWFILGLLLCAGIWISVHRRALFLPGKTAVILTAVSVLASFYVLYCVLPREIDGGIYFTYNAYDHCRTALINSIALKGLPAVNPFLSDYGTFLTAIYHYGFHATAAQPVILFDVEGYIAGAGLNGLVMILLVNTVMFLYLHLMHFRSSQNRIPLFLGILFVISFLFQSNARSLLQHFPSLAGTPLYTEQAAELGYWDLLNDITWQPHTLYSAVLTVTFLFLYCMLLNETDRRESFRLSVLLGCFAGAASVCSIYSGAFALLLLLFVILGAVMVSRTIRTAVLQHWKEHLLILTLAVLIISPFLFTLVRYSGYSSGGIRFSLPAAYETVHGFKDFVLAFAGFYLAVLPIHTGAVYLVGTMAILIPGVLPKDRFFSLAVPFVLLSNLIIFFFQSRQVTNDFGWRMPTPARIFLWLFSVMLVSKICILLHRKNRTLSVLFAGFVLLSPLAVAEETILNGSVNRRCMTPLQHREFAQTAQGWKTVRQVTDASDFVLCSPEAYSAINDSEGTAPNYLFSYYSGRFTPMSDLDHYTITSFSGPASLEEHQFIYDQIVRFFGGSPDSRLTDYIADQLDVKALLVTREDGLFTSVGALESRYKMMEQKPAYQVYLRIE